MLWSQKLDRWCLGMRVGSSDNSLVRIRKELVETPLPFPSKTDTWRPNVKLKANLILRDQAEHFLGLCPTRKHTHQGLSQVNEPGPESTRATIIRKSGKRHLKTGKAKPG